MSLYVFKLGLGNHTRPGEENNLFGTRENLKGLSCVRLVQGALLPSSAQVQAGKYSQFLSRVYKILRERKAARKICFIHVFI